jgi:hypothetical protein
MLHLQAARAFMFWPWRGFPTGFDQVRPDRGTPQAGTSSTQFMCVISTAGTKVCPLQSSYRVISTSLPPDAANRALCALIFISLGEQ